MKFATRAIVIVGGLAWLSLVVGIFGGGAQGWIYWTSLVVFFITWILSRLLSRDIAEKRAADLDEYEAGLKSRARNASYWVTLLTGTGLFVLLTFFAGEAQAGNRTLLLHAPSLVLAMVLAAAAVPTFLLAWTARHEGVEMR